MQGQRAALSEIYNNTSRWAPFTHPSAACDWDIFHYITELSTGLFERADPASMHVEIVV